MIGRTANGDRHAFLIEWKYTEAYAVENKYKTKLVIVYDNLIHNDISPFKPIDPSILYFEPFYQLMRQTLLGWKIAKNKDHGCSSFRHVLVVPKENVEFHKKITSAKLGGTNLAEAWSSLLRNPEWFIGTTPVNFLQPILDFQDMKSLTGYLKQRYWLDA